ncbi:SRR1-like protein isoform X1 [Mustela putorius furo]|uniref:SRR1-like protein isoform X1 n=1 Tax=Mustela putorius furo TaxID=9669 RepID=A0A8U0N382_MUSPF|nr:SRR1-like protein isoform X1 [Mustela putorius furo]
MASAALEPWQAAAPRRKRRSAERRPRGREVALRDLEAQPEVDCGVVLRRIREAGKDLLLSDFWSLALETINSCLTKHLEQLKVPEGTLLEALRNLHLDSSPNESAVTPGFITGENQVPGTCCWKCVCYGIGNFATCVIARHQLTFLLLFLEKCQIPRRHCWVYDPLFSQLEIAVLKSLGVTVLSENELLVFSRGSAVTDVDVSLRRVAWLGTQEGRRSIHGEPTIFYMPHCGTALYNNLLCSNWSVESLAKMLIIGNSFRGLEERLLARILQKNYAYIAKVLKGLEELELPETSQYMDVFNDTSIHWFPVQKLRRLPTDTWAFREEPDYQDCEDLEIIRNKRRAPSAADQNLPWQGSCPQR